jgi:hypothetical protein
MASAAHRLRITAVLHCNVFTKAVRTQSNQQLALSRLKLAVALYFHTKRLKEEQHKRI